jgi:hypothetical protein
MPSRDGSAKPSLDVLLDGPRPGRHDAEADRAWLAGRRRIDALTVCTEFDPRNWLGLSPAALVRWRERRRAYLARVFA